MEYMAKCMGLKIKDKEGTKHGNVAEPRLATLLEQAVKEPHKTQQIALPLAVLQRILSYCKKGPDIQQKLKTQSLFEFSLAAAESWETAGLKNARSKLNQKAQKALRKKDMDELGDDRETSSSITTITNDLASLHENDDDVFNDGEFLEHYDSV
jgi:hypothetical protein